MIIPIPDELHPIGSVVSSIDGAEPGPPWHHCLGQRLKRKQDPELYDVLKPNWSHKYLRWIVHIPNLNNLPKLEGAPTVNYYIKGSR